MPLDKLEIIVLQAKTQQDMSHINVHIATSCQQQQLVDRKSFKKYRPVMQTSI